MPEVNNTEKLRAWLRTCPQVAKSKPFGADHLGENATEYGLMSVPSTLRYRTNIKGERKLREQQEQNFIFAAKVPYGADVQQNLMNSGFFQDVMDWIVAQNVLRNFPEWDGKVTSVDVLSTGAPIQTGTDSARYQFQIRVNYNINESE